MKQVPLHMLSLGIMLGTTIPGSSSPYQDIITTASPPPVVAPVEIVPPPVPAATVKRNSQGQYYAIAKVNGTPVKFLVDTGATAVALSVEDARRVGINMDPRSMKVIGTGASGPVRGKLVTLEEVKLGHKMVPDVHGAVLEGSRMSLLGTSFLAKMDRIEIAGDTMTIH